MDIVADFHDISDRQRLQISTDRRPMRRASVVMAALLSSEGEELLSLNLLIASTSSLDKVVTMDTLLAFSVGNANFHGPMSDLYMISLDDFRGDEGNICDVS